MAYRWLASWKGKPSFSRLRTKEYAAEAYDLDAVDYLRKPYQPPRLEKAMEKAKIWLSALESRTAVHIELNTDRGKARINMADIAYITVADNDRRDKVVALKSGVQHLAKNITFDQLQALAPETPLCRVNRSTLLAPDTVVNYTASWVLCQSSPGGETVQFSLTEQYRAGLLSRLPR